MAKKSRGLRHNGSKTKIHLVPEEAILAIARGFMAGEKKYPKFNYRLGHSWLEISDSLRRHLLSWLMGNDIDEESGCYNTELILTNAAMLEYNRIHHKDLDDRYTPEKYKNVKTKVHKVPRKRSTSKARK